MNTPNKPTFSLIRGMYFTEQSIKLRSTTPNLNVYYTLDGSEKTNKSKVFTNPLRTHQTMTLPAIAISKERDN